MEFIYLCRIPGLPSHRDSLVYVAYVLAIAAFSHFVYSLRNVRGPQKNARDKKVFENA